MFKENIWSKVSSSCSMEAYRTLVMQVHYSMVMEGWDGAEILIWYVKWNSINQRPIVIFAFR